MGIVGRCRHRSSNMTWGTETPAEVAAALPHYAQGPIVKGFGRGSTELGFPTANFSEEVIEALPEALIGGIYWGLAQVDNGQVRDMVIILGFIRPEQNFDSLEALVDAIRKDIEEGRKRGSEESWSKYRADPCFQ